MSIYIEKITVKKLFGHYNFVVERESSSLNIDPLIIIYGDNGSGKTTLLELIFNLISTVGGAGHKSKIAKIKFESFSILLQKNIEIIAQRENNQLIGSFNFILKENGRKIKSVFLTANKDLNIRTSEGNQDTLRKYREILEYISNLRISIHYLSDNRKLFAGVRRYLDNTNNIRRKQDLSIIFSEKGEENDLILATRLLENWIKKHILQGSKEGDRNINSIYTDLIKRASVQNTKLITEQDVLDLVYKLTEIRDESKLYSRYGLVSRIETREIEQALKDPTKYNPSIIYNVLEPYVEGIRGRLDSLKEIQDIIELFINEINDYFSNKIIKYHLVKGFTIVNKEFNEPIDFQMLSSGEKQLLLLFCNVITASDDASIFIIDEPEISLNIKWQRKLIKTLLDFSRNKKVQFVFASHSLEILTGHRDSVVKLQHIVM